MPPADQGRIARARRQLIENSILFFGNIVDFGLMSFPQNQHLNNRGPSSTIGELNMRTTSGRKYVRKVGMQWGHVPARNENLKRGLVSASETWCAPNRWFPLREVMMQRNVVTYCNALCYIYMCVCVICVIVWKYPKTCHTIIKTCSMPTFVLIWCQTPGQKNLVDYC